jgi:hypothetical protein
MKNLILISLLSLAFSAFVGVPRARRCCVL